MRGWRGEWAEAGATRSQKVPDGTHGMEIAMTIEPRIRRITFLATMWLLAACFVFATDSAIPRLERRGRTTQLIVDGKPFLILGGELHNSSSSSLAYMEPIWPRLVAAHLNTVLAPVSWESIEPEEGKYDFTLLDGLIAGARKNQLRLVFLWFGSWKNTYSSYVPAWVKRDQKRFPRVELHDGRGTERLSPFSAANRDADGRAFAALMRHLREVDGDAHTVLMMQVENEIGVIPESRDHSAAAEAAFKGPVPSDLTNYLRQHADNLDPVLRSAWQSAGRKLQGSWSELFGPGALTDDFFMAWYYARYVSAVAAAGRREYLLPMFANAALIRPNYVPGQYNSGGPLPHSRDIWQAAAPDLTFLSPDIYFEDFATWAEKYVFDGNPLFIPEAVGREAGAANALYAFGQLNAIGFSPFGIEDELPDGSGRPGAASAPIANCYAALAHLSPLILDKQTSGDIAGIVLETEAQRFGRLTFGDYTMTITRAPDSSRTPPPRIAALFLRMNPDEYIVVSSGKGSVSFSPATAGPPQAGIVSIDEEVFTDGKWMPGRRLNGDENAQGQLLKLPSPEEPPTIFHVKLYRYR